MSKIVLISGGFDPIHSGHINLIMDAGSYGEVVILLNSDNWLKNKKGKEFLQFSERKAIMLGLKKVIDVIKFDDSDTTCVDGIRKAIKHGSSFDIWSSTMVIIGNAIPTFLFAILLIVIFAGGTGNPYFTTDSAAALRAI